MLVVLTVAIDTTYQYPFRREGNLCHPLRQIQYSTRVPNLSLEAGDRHLGGWASNKPGDLSFHTGCRWLGETCIQVLLPESWCACVDIALNCLLYSSTATRPAKALAKWNPFMPVKCAPPGHGPPQLRNIPLRPRNLHQRETPLHEDFRRVTVTILIHTKVFSSYICLMYCTRDLGVVFNKPISHAVHS